MEFISKTSFILIVLVLILPWNRADRPAAYPAQLYSIDLSSSGGTVEPNPAGIRELMLSNEEKNYTTHSPINITSDADFLAQKVSEGWTGDGTQNNPYIIEAYNITYNGWCISIENVTAYFIIRDCLLVSPGDPPPPGSYDDGIAVASSSHGMIVNNTFIDSRDAGIFIGWSHCDAIDNLFIGGQAGIFFYKSYGSAIFNEFVDIDGRCVWIYNSLDCNVSLNVMTSNDAAIELDSSSYCTVSHNQIESRWAGIHIWNDSMFNHIEFNEIDGADYGIYAEEIHFSNLSANRIQRSRSSGIMLIGCQSNQILKNVIIDGLGEGITIVGTDLCSFLYNEIIRNAYTGIYLAYGFDNAIYGNLLQDNRPDAIDDEWEHSNFWDDGVAVGNCWTYGEYDEGTDRYYLVIGAAGNVDHFRFRTEALDFNHPIIGSVPDTLIPIGIHTTITWMVWSESGTFTLLKNGEQIQSGDWNETEAFHHGFFSANLGSYNFTLVINDYDGNPAANTVIILVSVPQPAVQLFVYVLVGSMIAIVVVLELGESESGHVDSRV